MDDNKVKTAEVNQQEGTKTLIDVSDIHFAHFELDMVCRISPYLFGMCLPLFKVYNTCLSGVCKTLN